MPDYLISSGLPSYPANLPDKEVGMILPLYRAIHNLDNRLSVTSGNVQYSSAEMGQLAPFTGLIDANNKKIFAQATEVLTFGTVVNIYDVAGVVSARKADCALLYQAHGIVNSVSGAAIGAYCEILFIQGRTPAITGATLGTQYWLSTAGQVQAVKPIAPNIIQPVGYGLGTSGFYLNIESVR